MAKYATVEELWECFECGIEVSFDQMVTDHSRMTKITRHKCPKCNDVICLSEEGYACRASLRDIIHGYQ